MACPLARVLLREGNCCCCCFLAACSLQVIMLVLIILSFFVLTSQTLYVRLSKYDRYLREFRLLAITSLAELLLMLAAKGYFIVSH